MAGLSAKGAGGMAGASSGGDSYWLGMCWSDYCRITRRIKNTGSQMYGQTGDSPNHPSYRRGMVKLHQNSGAVKREMQNVVLLRYLAYQC